MKIFGAKYWILMRIVVKNCQTSMLAPNSKMIDVRKFCSLIVFSTNRIVPGGSRPAVCCSISNLAAPSNIVVCTSWPHECILPQTKRFSIEEKLKFLNFVLYFLMKNYNLGTKTYILTSKFWKLSKSVFSSTNILRFEWQILEFF